MVERNIGEVIGGAATEEVKKTSDPKKLTLESLLLLHLSDRLHKLENDSKQELLELKKRQQKVHFLHKISKAINTATSPKGEFDATNLNELQDMMKHAKTLGVDIDEAKLSYNSEERERLVDNIKMTIEDLNMQNEMQLQLVTRLTNERYESYQMARTILKPIHDDKMGKARAISGR
jgi:hypothetical protein